MNPSLINQKIIDGKIVAILRSSSSEHFLKAAEALIHGGVTTIEVTLTTPGALDSIRTLAREFKDQILLGVGTVMEESQVLQSIEAGACYVITPVIRPQVIALCRQQKISVLTGAYSPTEAQLAYELGSDFVKIFPAETLGIKYIKGLLAPLPHLRLIPTGGINEHNVADFIRAGCKAVGVGSSLVHSDILKQQDWKTLRELAARFCKNVKSIELPIQN